VIARAATKVALDAVADLLLTGVVVLPEERNRTHDHARSAESTLEAMALPEAFLDGIEFISVRDPLNGLHRSTVCLDREHGARLDGSTVDDDRACAAVAGVTTNMCSCESKVLAQIVNKKRSRFNVTAVLCSID
jgi:hypothetical protein